MYKCGNVLPQKKKKITFIKLCLHPTVPNFLIFCICVCVCVSATALSSVRSVCTQCVPGSIVDGVHPYLFCCVYSSHYLMVLSAVKWATGLVPTIQPSELPWSEWLRNIHQHYLMISDVILNFCRVGMWECDEILISDFSWLVTFTFWMYLWNSHSSLQAVLLLIWIGMIIWICN